MRCDYCGVEYHAHFLDEGPRPACFECCEIRAFWRGVCAGVAVAFDGFAREIERDNPADWRVDGCEQIASNHRRFAEEA